MSNVYLSKMMHAHSFFLANTDILQIKHTRFF